MERKDHNIFGTVFIDVNKSSILNQVSEAAIQTPKTTFIMIKKAITLVAIIFSISSCTIIEDDRFGIQGNPDLLIEGEWDVVSFTSAGYVEDGSYFSSFESTSFNEFMGMYFDRPVRRVTMDGTYGNDIWIETNTSFGGQETFEGAHNSRTTGYEIQDNVLFFDYPPFDLRPSDAVDLFTGLDLSAYRIIRLNETRMTLELDLYKESERFDVLTRTSMQATVELVRR